MLKYMIKNTGGCPVVSEASFFMAKNLLRRRRLGFSSFSYPYFVIYLYFILNLIFYAVIDLQLSNIKQILFISLEIILSKSFSRLQKFNYYSIIELLYQKIEMQIILIGNVGYFTTYLNNDVIFFYFFILIFHCRANILLV